MFNSQYMRQSIRLEIKHTHLACYWTITSTSSTNRRKQRENGTNVLEDIHVTGDDVVIDYTESRGIVPEIMLDLFL